MCVYYHSNGIYTLKVKVPTAKILTHMLCSVQKLQHENANMLVHILRLPIFAHVVWLHQQSLEALSQMLASESTSSGLTNTYVYTCTYIVVAGEHSERMRSVHKQL